jgi:hypothetical protein
MKVKITKCSKNGWWYDKYIGKIFEVYGDSTSNPEVDDYCYYTYETDSDRQEDIKCWISKDDCEFVNERGGEQMVYITREEYEKFMAAVDELKNKDMKNVTININVNSANPKEHAEKVIQILTEQLAKLSLM